MNILNKVSVLLKFNTSLENPTFFAKLESLYRNVVVVTRWSNWTYVYKFRFQHIEISGIDFLVDLNIV